MSDKMRMFSFESLLQRIFNEYGKQKSILDIPEANWYRKEDNQTVSIFSEQMETVLGPAAGPHTQLAINIVVSYLTGSRFIELKTVQILDSLEIEKPCIDMTDEGYNTEWSTELSLEEAWEEYAKAWILLHIIERVFNLKKSGAPRSFIFNMSVGYDLKGIKEERMQQYISRLKNSGKEPAFREWLEQCETRLPHILENAGLSEAVPRIKGLAEQISPCICSSVTLSTMHGCPPHEIEAICSYMLREQNLDTYVKLNPTLLGYERVSGILSKLGFDYVEMNPDGFEHDLQYADAVPMLERLEQLAQEQGRSFGVKLTNTLASRNTGDELPGEEMYLSGRALFPVTITLAAQLARKFNGRLPISYSGGVAVHNSVDLFRTGIRPITLATDLLKPGGYLRQTQMAKEMESVPAWNLDIINVEEVEKLAEDALVRPEYRKNFRGFDTVDSPGDLPLFNCYEAPCVTACAIRQHIPEYIRLAGEGRYGEALGLIYERNALPSMTGYICDHQCQLHCTRLDYEGCINIREIKKIAVQQGFDEYRSIMKANAPNRGVKAAVVGAGPAGLSAAYFLAREGFRVTIFEREEDAGGVIRYVVPHFRIPREGIESDVDHIRKMGVEFVFNWDKDIDVDQFKKDGFQYVLLGLGTYRSRDLNLKNAPEGRVHSAYGFLDAYNRDSSQLDMGEHVVVIGAGDTAMDCARAALRCPGVKDSSIVYRRAFNQMPASREEYELAMEDGVGFHWLMNPEEFTAEGTLLVHEMKLGEKDSSGRARPVPTGNTTRIPADSLVYAIGDDPDPELLESIGLVPDKKTGLVKTGKGGATEIENVFLVGDSRTGSSTIVQCIQEGRNAADEICRKEEPGWVREEYIPPMNPENRKDEIQIKRGAILGKPNARTEYKESEFASREIMRCLECDFVCNKCVDVCPNRANIAVPVEDGFGDPFQIVHIDAYCNECGNCGHFCPWKGGLPYVDKPTVFSTLTDFKNSSNPGWLLSKDKVLVRYEKEEREFSKSDFLSRKDDKTLDISSRRFALLFSILHESRTELFEIREEE